MYIDRLHLERFLGNEPVQQISNYDDVGTVHDELAPLEEVIEDSIPQNLRSSMNNDDPNAVWKPLRTSTGRLVNPPSWLQ